MEVAPLPFQPSGTKAKPHLQSERQLRPNPKGCGMPAHAAIPAAPREAPAPMVINLLTIQPLIALIAGILILIVPRLLNYIVAIYLIIIGVSGLWPHLIR
jgi:hypothetical protein